MKKKLKTGETITVTGTNRGEFDGEYVLSKVASHSIPGATDTIQIPLKRRTEKEREAYFQGYKAGLAAATINR